MNYQHKEINKLNDLLDVVLPGYKFAVVKFKDLKKRDVNARYMRHEQFRQLVKNIKNAGKLESIPYCHKIGDDKYEIISGHHRIEASMEAGQEYGIIMYDEGLTEDQVKSKQLAHNALSGEDDPVLLQQIYDSIKDLSAKLATGLSSRLEKIQIMKIAVQSEKLKEFILAFTDSDIDDFDKAIAECSHCKPSSVVRIAPMEYYDDFLKVMKKIKKVENIKSNSLALIKLCELAMEKLNENGGHMDT